VRAPGTDSIGRAPVEERGRLGEVKSPGPAGRSARMGRPCGPERVKKSSVAVVVGVVVGAVVGRSE